MNQLLRKIPPVHELLNHPRLMSVDMSKQPLKEIIQSELESVRQLIIENKLDQSSSNEIVGVILDRIEEKIEEYSPYYLQRVVNATGTILHTNLGRARLSERAVEHVVHIAKNYSNLEYKITEGKRGSRHDIVEELIKKVTGAEAAMVVNNNAAAVYLILRGLAEEKEVIVSRGQLVEIGGSFRVSSIMEESDAKLMEVGTTNKTHLYDYEKAINEETAMLMKVHTSNFKLIGFTASVSTSELVQLKERHEGVLLYEDLGSGALFNFTSLGIGEEPLVKEVINEGADIVSFSGDKLLGGPQAGIIAGKKEIIKKLKSHQLARVLRIDKMTLAALEATLEGYIHGEEDEIPTIRDITQTVDDIKGRAIQFMNRMDQVTDMFQLSIEEDVSQIGGGTMPEVRLPTFAVKVVHSKYTAAQLSEILRNSSPCIVPRISQDKVVLDFRTITDDELHDVMNVFEAIH